MKIDDYLLDHADVDWPTVLGSWHWLLPETLTVWLVNRFGDIFAALDDSTIHMIDVGGGTFERVADSRGHFCDLLDADDNASDWLMIPLIDDLVAAGKSLRKGYCYGYLQNPVLGGDYTVDNTIVIPIPEHYGLNAEIHQQSKTYRMARRSRSNSLTTNSASFAAQHGVYAEALRAHLLSLSTRACLGTILVVQASLAGRCRKNLPLCERDKCAATPCTARINATSHVSHVARRSNSRP